MPLTTALPLFMSKFIVVNDYHVAGKFGGGKVWRIDSFQTFVKRKFDKLIDQPIDY